MKVIPLIASTLLMAGLLGLTGCGRALPASFGGGTPEGPAGSAGGQSSVASEAPSVPPKPPSGPAPRSAPQEVMIPAPSLAGSAVGESEQQGLVVLLPPGYHESEARYPVIYYLPGYTEDYRQAMPRFEDAMNARAQAGEDAGVIVVTVNGINLFGGCFYANSAVTGNWQDFVVEDVVNYIDGTYRTVADAAFRGLVGHSMGGAGAVNIALERPGVFGWIYAMSPAIIGDGGFEQSGVLLETVLAIRNHYAAMRADDIGREYLADTRGGVWREQAWTLAYGSAFVGDVTIGPPWIGLPGGTVGAWHNDAVLRRYYAGLGDFGNRVPAMAGNLRQLKGLAIDYGRQDTLTWIPPGCEYLSAQLAACGIAHVLEAYEGDHNNQVDRRVAGTVLPFFMSGFAAR